MKISLKDDNNEMVQYDVVCTIESKDSENKYICYTDNTKDLDGNTKIYISSYAKENDEMKLFPIKTKKEWEWVIKILNDRTNI